MDGSTGQCSCGAGFDRHSGTLTTGQVEISHSCGRTPAGAMRAFWRRQEHVGETLVGSPCCIHFMAMSLSETCSRDDVAENCAKQHQGHETLGSQFGLVVSHTTREPRVSETVSRQFDLWFHDGCCRYSRT